MNEINSPIKLCITFIQFAGFWPLATPSRIPLVLNFVMGKLGYIFLATTFVFVQFYGFFVTDVTGLIQKIPVVAIYSHGLMKWFSLTHYNRKYRNLVEAALNIEEVSIKNPKLRYIVYQYRKDGRYFIFLWSFMIAVIAAIFLLSPFIEEKLLSNDDDSGFRPLYSEAWLPFGLDRNKYYFYEYFHHFLILLIGSGTQLTFDCFLVILMKHASLRLRLLQVKLARLTVHKGNNKRNLFDVYTDVQSFMKFLRDLDTLISNIMFAYLAITTIILCCVSYELTIPGKSGMELTKAIFSVAIVMSQIYFIFANGHDISFQSDKLMEASYSCKWYYQDPHFQKMFMILRFSFYQTKFVSAGIFYKVSLNTYLQILKTAYSGFTLLRQFNV